MMVLRRAYKFLLRPKGQQAAALDTMLASHRELYNSALEERHEAWRKCGVRVTFTQQSAQLPHCVDWTVPSLPSTGGSRRGSGPAIRGSRVPATRLGDV